MAFLVLEACFWPHLTSGDMKHAYCTDEAADLCGYDSVYALLAQAPYLSQLQTYHDRLAGRYNWFLRNHGHDIPVEYATRIQAQDGSFVWQKRRLAEVTKDLAGKIQYRIEIQPATEGEEATIPRLCDYGTQQCAVEAYNGKYSVRQLQEMTNQGTLPVKWGETFTTIVAQCEKLSTGSGLPAGSGVPYALSPRVVWGLYGAKKGVVSHYETCDACGFTWKTAKRHRTQCPGCKAHRERREG